MYNFDIFDVKESVDKRSVEYFYDMLHINLLWNIKAIPILFSKFYIKLMKI